jgi:hypothetical protein
MENRGFKFWLGQSCLVTLGVLISLLGAFLLVSPFIGFPVLLFGNLLVYVSKYPRRIRLAFIALPYIAFSLYWAYSIAYYVSH